MTGPISTTIDVYLSTDDTGAMTAQCFPNSQILVPPDCVATVTWQAIASPSGKPMPQFYRDSIQSTGPDKAKVQITKPSSTTPFVSSFVSTITNSGTSSSVDAGIVFSVTYPTGGQPPVVNGGGTIRNKGTSIWVWDLIAAPLSSIVVGVLVAYALQAAAVPPAFVILGAALTGIAAGAAAAYTLRWRLWLGEQKLFVDK
jgi:hypothetical protein